MCTAVCEVLNLKAIGLTLPLMTEVTRAARDILNILTCSNNSYRLWIMHLYLSVAEPRLSELRLTETPVRRCDSQNCLPRDTSQPLAVSLLSKVDEWQIDVCAAYSVVVTFV
jgi:hypothetical protein